MKLLKILGVAVLPALGLVACSVAAPSDHLDEFDARVRGDFFIPEETPHPKVVIVDAKGLSSLPSEYRDFLRASGGALYDPNTQTIYLDGSRYREGILYHELAHHYIHFMSEQQRFECLARLYEVHVSSNSSFAGCPPNKK